MDRTLEELDLFVDALEIEIKDRLISVETLLTTLDSKVTILQSIANMNRTITKYAFLSRFTLIERKALRNLANTNEDVLDMMELLKVAESINLDEVSVYFPLLVGLGVLTEERSREILYA